VEVVVELVLVMQVVQVAVLVECKHKQLHFLEQLIQ
jgi:hypothetical protein